MTVMRPITVRRTEGGTVQIFPERTIRALEEDPCSTRVWHYDADGVIEEVVVRAELEQIRAVLGLDDLEDGEDLGGADAADR